MSGTGDWVAGDTVTLTINGNDLVVTVGSTDLTDSNVANAVSDAINATSRLDGTGDTDATSNVGGQEIPEFTEVTATFSSNVVTVTANTAGKPFTLTVTESTTGDETATEATATTATGPNFWDNADNWSGDTVPVHGDTVVFDTGDVDCLYNLSAAIQPAVLIITQGYTGKIGLAEVNADDTSNKYPEYRTKYLTFDNDAGTSTTTCTVGDGDGEGSGRIRIDAGAGTQWTINVNNSGQRELSEVPAILWIGSDTDNTLNVNRGDFAAGFYAGESYRLEDIRVGFVESQESDAKVFLSDGQIEAAPTMDVSGGTLVIDGTDSGGTLTITGGEVIRNDGTQTTVNVYNGVYKHLSSGTLSNLNIGGQGVADFRGDVESKTVTNCDMWSGAQFLDPAGVVTVTNGWDLNSCRVEDVVIQSGYNFTLTKSAI